MSSVCQQVHSVAVSPTWGRWCRPGCTPRSCIVLYRDLMGTRRRHALPFMPTRLLVTALVLVLCLQSSLLTIPITRGCHFSVYPRNPKCA